MKWYVDSTATPLGGYTFYTALVISVLAEVPALRPGRVELQEHRQTCFQVAWPSEVGVTCS